MLAVRFLRGLAAAFIGIAAVAIYASKVANLQLGISMEALWTLTGASLVFAAFVFLCVRPGSGGQHIEEEPKPSVPVYSTPPAPVPVQMPVTIVPDHTNALIREMREDRKLLKEQLTAKDQELARVYDDRRHEREQLYGLVKGLLYYIANKYEFSDAEVVQMGKWLKGGAFAAIENGTHYDVIIFPYSNRVVYAHELPEGAYEAFEELEAQLSEGKIREIFDEMPVAALVPQRAMVSTRVVRQRQNLIPTADANLPHRQTPKGYYNA